MKRREIRLLTSPAHRVITMVATMFSTVSPLPVTAAPRAAARRAALSVQANTSGPKKVRRLLAAGSGYAQRPARRSARADRLRARRARRGACYARMRASAAGSAGLAPIVS